MLTKSCTAALYAAANVLPAFVPSAPVLTFPGTHTALNPDDPRFVECGDDGWPLKPVSIGVDLWGRDFLNVKDCRILDAAHNFLSPRHRLFLCELDRAVCYSFGPQKELSAPLGGAAVFGSSFLAAKASRMLSAGAENRGPVSDSDPTLRLRAQKGLMPEPIAAFLLGQLECLQSRQRVRKDVLRYYSKTLNLRVKLYTTPNEASGHLCVVRVPACAEARIRLALRDARIETSKHYRVSENFLLTYPATKGLISLPCHHAMEPRDVEEVVSIIQAEMEK